MQCHQCCQSGEVITVTVKRKPAEIEICVADAGIGISAEALDQAEGAFFE